MSQDGWTQLAPATLCREQYCKGLRKAVGELSVLGDVIDRIAASKKQIPSLCYGMTRKLADSIPK
jgi:hypothetical protein